MYQTRLPNELERVLSNREQRSAAEVHQDIEPDQIVEKSSDTDFFSSDQEKQDENHTKIQPNKLKHRKRKKKPKNPQNRSKIPPITEKPPPTSEPLPENVVVEYLEEEIKFDVNDPNYLDYTRILDAFKTAEARSQPNRVVVRNDSNAVKDEAMNVVPVKARGAYAQLEVEKEVVSRLTV
ncbi:uncharacterized protein LOC115228257 [Octopus sinensis]|uniref:Uncharacterized protein LOC115228257 n=1 Tax=Octopus sinensis TaxID=2607531 RepID=A0A7E6EGU0_9MOLL|nr:uncharacterized protein LOC115228257 [Octopus sinensis]